MGKLLWTGLLMMGMVAGQAGAADYLVLPEPGTTGGMPLMQALKARQSGRDFAERTLPSQVLSDLLWAAGGVNRPDTGKRTAPSARDWREIDIHVFTADGVFVYEPAPHALRRISDRDLRALTGRQDFPAAAPLNLVYVADTGRMTGVDAEMKEFYAAADSGFIAQNVYLYCASAGLASVVRGSVDREALAAALALGPEQRITLAQTVGYPR